MMDELFDAVDDDDGRQDGDDMLWSEWPEPRLDDTIRDTTAAHILGEQVDVGVALPEISAHCLGGIGEPFDVGFHASHHY